MPEENEFQPDWASPPGDTIADILEENGIPLGEFARRLGTTPENAQELLSGRAAITLRTARQLEAALGGSAIFWRSREDQYRNDLARLRAKTDPGQAERWLRELPVKDMLTFGWLAPCKGLVEQLRGCLQFFGVRDVPQWHQKYSNVLPLTAFRTSPSFAAQPGAVAAWLRRGEIEASSTKCGPWDPVGFRKELDAIRRLTREKQPGVFIPQLRERCARHGVAVAIVRAPKGCRASGATRFLTAQQALLMLSFRYLSDDHFWFTFFHEAAHLLLHSKSTVFLEGLGSVSGKEENEANDFAARVLIPPESQAALFAMNSTAHEIIRFARHLGVSPGIVVGQLQHLERIPRNHLNRLKRRFEWG